MKNVHTIIDWCCVCVCMLQMSHSDYWISIFDNWFLFCCCCCGCCCFFLSIFLIQNNFGRILVVQHQKAIVASNAMTHDYGQMRWSFLCCSCCSHKHISVFFCVLFWVRVHFVKCGVFNWIGGYIQPYDFWKLYMRLLCVREFEETYTHTHTQRMINKCEQNYKS